VLGAIDFVASMRRKKRGREISSTEDYLGGKGREKDYLREVF